MSTRCNVLVRYNNNSDYMHQYYHHHDGYPEGVGAVLDAFITTAQVTAKSKESIDLVFKMLLTAEGDFEDEGYNEGLHGDIEFLWFVDLTTFKLTYNKIDVPTFCPFDNDISNEEWEKLRNLKEGEIEFKTKIIK